VNIYPQDLGEKRHVALVYGRAYSSSSGGAKPPVDRPAIRPHMGRLGRFWSRGSGLTEEQAAAALPASSTVTNGYLYAIPAFWTFLGGIVTMALVAKGVVDGPSATAAIVATTTAATAGVTGLSLLAGRGGFRNQHKPLTAAEVEALPAGHDELEKSYLSLVAQAIGQEVPREAEDQVRNALRTIGESIGRLPAVPLQEENVETLQEKALSLYQEANAEKDPVIAESLVRQAESWERRAETVRRSAQYARRAATIRRELQAQIETLRTGLSAYNTGAGSVLDLGTLAEAVRSVATEANALSDARTELDTFKQPITTHPLTTPVTEKQEEQKLLRVGQQNN
jgi:hypothetical protein